MYQITVYNTERKYSLGSLIAVNKEYICYALRDGALFLDSYSTLVPARVASASPTPLHTPLRRTMSHRTHRTRHLLRSRL